MKKGQIYEGIVEKVSFPNKGIVLVDDRKVVVKNTVPGQKVEFMIQKIRKGKAEGRLQRIIEKSPKELDEVFCSHFGICGGCTYQNLSYEQQLDLKEAQVKELLDSVCNDYIFEGIKGSPKQFGYRNKMEFSFGDEVKGGPLALGMHKRGSFYDIVPIADCKIADSDFCTISQCVLAYFRERNVTFYKKMQHIGYLRHLVIRRGEKTGDILVNLVTSTQEDYCLNTLREALLALTLNGKIVGILHTLNDSLADVVQSDEMRILYGQDFFHEELLGLTFKISPFSFFQTNSLGAELLYETARGYIGDLTDKNCVPDKVVFDLYSGTGTIAQMLAPVARKVVGVEIVEEAVEAAKENAKRNHLTQCEFMTGDVLKVIDNIVDRPDFIVLDPPRDGIHPKALQKIIEFGVERMVYISCKPTSLVRDLEVLQASGYQVEKCVCVDMFAGTSAVETVVALHRKDT